MRWIGIFILCIITTKNAFANDLIKDNSNQSVTAIILGVMVLTAIFFILIRKQKRRFND